MSPEAKPERSAVRTWDRTAAIYDRFLAGYLTGCHEALLERLELAPGERVLDVGCGTGGLEALLCRQAPPDCTLIGIDPAPRMIARAQAKFAESACPVTFLTGHLEDLPSEAIAPVDWLVSSNVLHWLPDAERALAGWLRFLKPEGRLLTVCLDGDVAWQRIGISPWIHVLFPGFVRMWREAEVVALQESLGLQVIEVTHVRPGSGLRALVSVAKKFGE